MFGQRGGREAVKSHCGSDCSGRPRAHCSKGNNGTEMGREGKINLLLPLPPSPGHDGSWHALVWVLGFGFLPWSLKKQLRFLFLNCSMEMKEGSNSGSAHSQRSIQMAVISKHNFVCFVLQIQEFSSEFWTGTQLACWDRTEKPWSLFPKLSIYLRDENSSRSFRISILPQVSTFFVYSSVHLFFYLIKHMLLKNRSYF